VIVYTFMHFLSEESELKKPEENQKAEVCISARLTNESRLVNSIDYMFVTLKLEIFSNK
jgi:hypothetical protein